MKNAMNTITTFALERGALLCTIAGKRPSRAMLGAPWLASLLLCIFALMPLCLRAATNELSSALQTGLFEEEANRNLPAAIAAYEKVAKQFDQNRALAATAIFRLGEVSRKLGKTNEAAAFYQRILREFTDQDTLAKLSQQNLAGWELIQVHARQLRLLQCNRWKRRRKSADRRLSWRS